MTREETIAWLKRLGIAGPVDEEGQINLAGMDLEGADLVNADLRRAEMEGTNLRGANLVNADLRRANLCHANLRGAHLRYADLCAADLRGAHLEGANLHGAEDNKLTLWPEGVNLQATNRSSRNRERAGLLGCGLVVLVVGALLLLLINYLYSHS